jgi:hypothetical protein
MIEPGIIPTALPTLEQAALAVAAAKAKAEQANRAFEMAGAALSETREALRIAQGEYDSACGLLLTVADTRSVGASERL